MSTAERAWQDSYVVRFAPESESDVTVTVHMSRERAAQIVVWENERLATVHLCRAQAPPATLGTAVMSVLGPVAAYRKG